MEAFEGRAHQVMPAAIQRLRHKPREIGVEVHAGVHAALRKLRQVGRVKAQQVGMHTGHFGRVLAGQEALVSVLMPLERHVPAVKLRTLILFAGMQHQHEGLQAPG